MPVTRGQEAQEKQAEEANKAAMEQKEKEYAEEIYKANNRRALEVFRRGGSIEDMQKAFNPPGINHTGKNHAGKTKGPSTRHSERIAKQALSRHPVSL